MIAILQDLTPEVRSVVTLKPQDQWRAGLTWEGLIAEMDERLRYPSMPNIWWMPIQTRTEMLSTGIRSALGIKVYGPDLATIETTAVQVERALLGDGRTRPYTRSAFAERVTGGYFLDFDIDRERIARYRCHEADCGAHGRWDLLGHRAHAHRPAGGLCHLALA